MNILIKNNILKVFLLISVLSYSQNSDNQTNIVKYIKEKYILINNPNLLVSDNRYYILANKRYPIEEIIRYDSLGKAIEVLELGSEGFLIYQRENIKNKTLPFTDEMWEYSIKLSIDSNTIIDNNDTLFIKKIINHNIITEQDKDDRFRVYICK